MTNYKFTQLLRRCLKASERAQRLSADVAEECMRRYGTASGELDLDAVRDAIEYGADAPTAEQVDQEMKERRLSKAI